MNLNYSINKITAFRLLQFICLYKFVVLLLYYSAFPQIKQLAVVSFFGLKI